ncbi:MAG: Eco57I restriction-modification methylase domain-containing protein [Ktedonobacteraceae bacterium]
MMQSAVIKKRYTSVAEQKAIGATYTPARLADFVAEKIVEVANVVGIENINVLDPAVGDGELLLSLLRKLCPHAKSTVIVHGFDTDKIAIRETRRRISIEFPKVELHLELVNFLDFVISQRDTKASTLWSAPQAPVLFDIIIANPPYVRTQIMGAGQAQELTSVFGLSGRVDLYHAFLIGMAQVLRPGGTAGIIVSNRFMTTKGGASVREALHTRFALRHIWDLGDTKLFDAAVLPAVILAEGRNDHTPEPTAFSSIYETDDPAAIEVADPIAALAMVGTVSLTDGRRFRVQHGTLDRAGKDGIWRIATDSSDAWLATVKAHSWGTFRDIGKIRVGVKTCADKIFIRSDWDSLPKHEQPELLRPLTTHHIARRFRAASPKKALEILYPHEVVQGQRRAVDIASYPKTRNYLESHRPPLEGRSYVIEGGRLWYEIWVPQDPAAWAAPKLVFRDISEQPTFWIDLDGSIVNGDCYWITAARADQEHLLWLAAAVANSTFAEAFYDHRFNNKLYAGRRRFITQYVEQFPLPDPATTLAHDIIAGAKAIYEAVGTANAVAMEKRLDQMVWQAFGLPFEEVTR